MTRVSVMSCDRCGAQVNWPDMGWVTVTYGAPLRGGREWHLCPECAGQDVVIGINQAVTAQSPERPEEPEGPTDTTAMADGPPDLRETLPVNAAQTEQAR